MRRFLAVDGGATATRAALFDEAGTRLAEAGSRPSNPVAYGIDGCIGTFADLARELLPGIPPERLVVVCGISGARQPELREAIAHALCQVLHAEKAIVSDDLYPLLWANARIAPAILVIAGTGSSVLAQSSDGCHARTGGYGGVLGDHGSAYGIAVSALRAAADAMDGLGPQTGLAHALCEATGLLRFRDLSDWAQASAKGDIAALAKVVSSVAEQGDESAVRCIMDHAQHLAAQALAAGKQLALPPETTVYMHGGLFEGCTLFRKTFENTFGKARPGAAFRKTAIEGPEAVVALLKAKELPDWAVSCARRPSGKSEEQLLATEQRYPGRSIDHMDALDIVHAMNREEDRIGATISRAAPVIASVIELVAEALRSGGRLIYVGAGTSGRLGILDAVECPPTFGVSPETVIGIVAGGEQALRQSVEGAEDDTVSAEADLGVLKPPVGADDVVIGISASSTTPYVRAALDAARARDAKTVLLCCNPPARHSADILIALETGPEVVAGSTRLKAGTATKRVLNMISTGAMARAGYLYEGLMVGVQPVSEKLQRRAARIVSLLTGLDIDAASKLLHEAGNRIPVAVLMARKSITAAEAANRLAQAGNVLRMALEDS